MSRWESGCVKGDMHLVVCVGVEYSVLASVRLCVRRTRCPC